MWVYEGPRGYSRKKALVLHVFCWVSQMLLLGPSRRSRRRQKKAENHRKRPISTKDGQTPLKPPFVTPPHTCGTTRVLHKFVGILLRTPQEGRAKLSGICGKFESQFWTILCKPRESFKVIFAFCLASQT